MAEMSLQRAARIVGEVAKADTKEITDPDPQVMQALCVLLAEQFKPGDVSFARRVQDAMYR